MSPLNNPLGPAEDVRVYLEWLRAEVTGPQWHVGHPPEFNGLPDDHMWGTCFNDECPDGVVDLGVIRRWRRDSREGMVTWSGLCKTCVMSVIYTPPENDGLGGGDDGAHRSVMPLCGEDRIARHFGWVKGVPHCPVGVICEHGWVLTQKIVDGWAEAERLAERVRCVIDDGQGSTKE